MLLGCFGNRTEENFGGSPSGNAPIPPSTNVAYKANNQVTSVNGGSGFTYDGSGDVTQDSENQYLYDADGHVCAAYDMLTHIMTGYLYDAEGNRVAKGTISTFSCDTASNGFSFPPSEAFMLPRPTDRDRESWRIQRRNLKCFRVR